MKPIVADKSWLEGFPPSTIFGALEVLRPVGNSEDRHKTLTDFVELMEAAAAIEPSTFLNDPGSLPVDEARDLALVYGTVLEIVQGGALARRLAITSLSGLRERYSSVEAQAVRSLRLVKGVLEAAIANQAGSDRGETLQQRLSRSVARARNEEPINLGSFAPFAKDD